MEKLGGCQQPLNEPSTLTAGHMVLRPLGHRLLACPAVSAAFNHSSFWLQLQAPHRPVRAKTSHSESPLSQRGRRAFTAGSRKSDHDTTSYRADRYTQVCLRSTSCCHLDKQLVSAVYLWFERYAQISQTIRRNEDIKHAHLLLENSP